MADKNALYKDNQQQKKSHKKRWLLLLLLLLLLLGTGGGVTAAVLLRDKTPETLVYVVFNPVKILNGQKTYLNSGADAFTINLAAGADEHTQTINEDLNSGETIELYYTITNNGPDRISWSLDLENLENSGFKIQFRNRHEDTDDSTTTDFNSGEQMFHELGAHEVEEFTVIFSVEDWMSHSISGVLVLTTTIA